MILFVLNRIISISSLEKTIFFLAWNKYAVSNWWTFLRWSNRNMLVVRDQRQWEFFRDSPHFHFHSIKMEPFNGTRASEFVYRLFCISKVFNDKYEMFHWIWWIKPAVGANNDVTTIIVMKKEKEIKKCDK